MLDREKLEEVFGAKRQIVDGSLVVWRTRLETLVNTGDERRAFGFLQTHVEPEEANNCDCPNNVAGCGQPIEVIGTVTPGEPTIE